MVAAVIAAGSEKAAAHRLGLSHSTVKHHLASARSKVGVATTAQLVWILAERLPQRDPPVQPGIQQISRWRCAVLWTGRQEVRFVQKLWDLPIPSAVTGAHPRVRGRSQRGLLQAITLEGACQGQSYQRHPPRVGRVPEPLRLKERLLDRRRWLEQRPHRTICERTIFFDSVHDRAAEEEPSDHHHQVVDRCLVDGQQPALLLAPDPLPPIPTKTGQTAQPPVLRPNSELSQTRSWFAIHGSRGDDRVGTWARQ